MLDDYIHDMQIVQHFATLNRKAMADEIIRGMKLEVAEQFTTIHNYIDIDQRILRKGAVSAMRGEKLLIPINMRDGSDTNLKTMVLYHFFVCGIRRNSNT